MKKSLLTKILLLSVMVLLAFALVACGESNNKPSGGNGGGNSGGGKNPGKTTPTDDEETEKTDEEIIAEMATSLKAIGAGANGIVETLKSVKANSTVGADVGVGVEFTPNGGDKFTASLGVKGNLKKQGSEVYLNAVVNNKEYVGLGYKNGAILLTEGLNMINSNATSANKIKIPVTVFSNNIDKVMESVMGQLENALSGLTIDIAGLIDGIVEDDSLKQILPGLSQYLEISKTKIAITNMQGVWNLASTFVAEPLKKIDPTVQQAITTVVGMNILPDNIVALLKDSKGAAYTLTTFINENISKLSLSIDVAYDVDNIKQLKVNLGIKDLFDFALVVDLNVFSTSKTATISDSEFTAQDLTLSAMVKAGNGVNGKLDVSLLTSSALTGNDKKLAVAKYNGREIAIINPTEAIFAFNRVLSKLGSKNATGGNLVSAFGNSETVDGVTNFTGINIIDELNTLLANAATAIAPKAANADGEEGGFDINAIINTVKDIWERKWDVLFAAIDKYLGENTLQLADFTAVINYKGTPAKIEEDVVKALYDNFGVKYLKFMEATDKSFKNDVWAHIKKIYNANKTTLENAVKADKATKYAGAQIVGGNANLLIFVNKFIKVISAPAIVDGAYKTDENGFVFGNAPENMDTQFIADWIEFAFSFVPQEYKDTYNSTMIAKIAGVGETAKDVLDAGVAAYARGGNGLEGYIGLAQDLTETGADAYLELGLGIKFERPISVEDIVVDETFAETTGNEVTDEEILGTFFEALKEIPVAAINYHAAE